MNTSFWTPYISDGTIKAICWTLIHSLWIGMIIALLAGVVVSLTRKSAAVLRYRLLCAVLVLFVISIGITYYVEARSNATTPVLSGAAKVFIDSTSASPSTYVAAAQNQSIIDRSREFLNQNMSIIFVVWLLFFVLKSLKMVSGLLYIQRIRNYKTHVVTEELKHKIEQLSSQMGIRRTVRLVQSELVKVPVAIGWLKPMILLPLGIALQLTPEQLEGILWHELAHIYRRDYLVNILQGLVETVFFFNPGLLWLSSLIRTEREACCDDMVLSRMNRKANYLEALLSFGYGEFKQAGFAMSLGSGNQLRERLKRMISQEHKRLGVVEKVVLITSIIVLSAFAGLTTKNAALHLTNAAIEKGAPGLSIVARSLAPQNITQVTHATDAPDKKVDISAHFFYVQHDWGKSDSNAHYISAEDVTGKKYYFTLTRDKLVALTINGNEIQKRDLPKYLHLLRQIPSPPPPPMSIGRPLWRIVTALTRNQTQALKN